MFHFNTCVSVVVVVVGVRVCVRTNSVDSIAAPKYRTKETKKENNEAKKNYITYI